jgi:hypothetical protein
VPGNGTELPPGTPPPPPPILDKSPETIRKRNRPALILGAHLGAELPGGNIPSPSGTSVSASDLSAGGLAFALDAGVLFAQHWYIGLTLEHAALGAGKDPSYIDASAGSVSSNTTTAGVTLGFVVNPDRVSFLGELGLQGRWYTLSWTDNTGAESANYFSPELLLGMGLWIPAGHVFRLVPEITAGLGSFSPPNGVQGDTAGHGFVMIGLAGLFSVGL